jgi:beta-phosphoglucomutase-like phosphatase (HAD superfamily)
MLLGAVLFELEGVLTETYDARRDALVSALRSDGIDVREEDYVDVAAGLSTMDAVRAMLALRGVERDATAIELLAHRVDGAYGAFVGKGITMVGGAREMLERFAAVTRLGIVTRAGRREVDLVLSLARLEHVFTCVIAAEDAKPPKPSSAPYRAALERIRRTRPWGPNAAIVALEDGRAGIRAAREAGARTVAVGRLPAHVAMDADAYLPSVTGLTPQQLMALLKLGEASLP